MYKKTFIKALILSAMLIILCVSFTACSKKDKEEQTAEVENTQEPTSEDEINQDFIIVGEDEGEPLIFYNLNYVTSVEELEEYVDIAYDFEEKPEIILAEAGAPEGIFEQVKEMLDQKGVVYVITEDEE